MWKMEEVRAKLVLLVLTLILFQPQTTRSYSDVETEALRAFQRSADVAGVLASNWTSTNESVCSLKWTGVSCDHHLSGVTSLVLPSLGLRGTLDTLSSLTRLRSVDLSGNQLNGTLDSLLSSLPNLRLLYLSGNHLSGPLPDSLSSLTRLRRLDLSANNLTGAIPPPAFFLNLTRLLTLRLQDNHLSGPVPDLTSALPELVELNLSNNRLEGPLPPSMRIKFGDAGLFPPSAPAVRSKMPATPTQTPPPPPTGSSRFIISSGAIIAIAASNAAFLLLLSSLLLFYCICFGVEQQVEHQQQQQVEDEDEELAGEGTTIKYYNSYYHHNSNNINNNNEGKLVVLGGGRLELEDLLRSSAEMVGKGSIGTVYRAVLVEEEQTRTVAVKRLRDSNPCDTPEEFQYYMDLIAKLNHHPNLVPLRAYYYAKHEKLLVYDFVPGCTLHALLHHHHPDWPTRLGLALATARALDVVHRGVVPHGNVTSTNVLVDDHGVPRLSDFGLALLLHPATAVAKLGAYCAPEQKQNQIDQSPTLSQEADVYAFGVILLELLTGKEHSFSTTPLEGTVLPDWVRSVVREEWTTQVFDAELLQCRDVEEEMVAMLHIALACLAHQPPQRPIMPEVVRMIGDIRAMGDYSPVTGNHDISVTTTDDDDDRC